LITASPDPLKPPAQRATHLSLEAIGEITARITSTRYK
jgi:hypothetical protein